MPSPNDIFTSGQILTAQECNDLPFGYVGSVVRTAGDIALGTGEADLTGMSISFTAIASRIYKVTVQAEVSKATADGNVRIYLKNGASYLNLAILTMVNGTAAPIAMTTLVTGLSAGAQTLKLTGSAAATATINGQSPTSTTAPFTFIIEDIGTA